MSLLPLLLPLPALAGIIEGVPAPALLIDPPGPELEPPVRWLPAEASYTLEPVEGGLSVELHYRIESLDGGWVFAPLVDGALILESADPGVHNIDGRWWYLGRGGAAITLRGFLPAGGGGARLGVAPAARQFLRTRTDPGVELTVDGALDGLLPPTDVLSIHWGPRPAPSAPRPVVQGRVAAAVTVADDGVIATARMGWRVRRGALEVLEVALPSGLEELEITGPPGARWTRDGDVLRVHPAAPIRDASELLLRWRIPLREGAAAVDLPDLPGTSSTESYLSLASDGERVLSPRADGGRPAPLSALPDWARGLSEARTLAAWSGAGRLTLRALDLRPMEGPPLVVDAARCKQATAWSGRSLLRCQLDVRNASRQFLGVALPPGWSLWIARVNGDAVAPASEPGRALVPLERSVETMEGLTTLDVDLVFQVEGEPWGHRGERELALPALDAPVARLEWSLSLPPGLRGRRAGGSARLPAQPSGELVYGFTSSRTQNLWTEALRAYQDSRFDEASAYLEALEDEDADYRNAARLRSNLEVLTGRAELSDEEEAQARRVKELARAKVAEEQERQKDKLAEVERRLQSGEAAQVLEELEELELENRVLSYVEQEENAEASYVSKKLARYKAEATRQRPRL